MKGRTMTANKNVEDYDRARTLKTIIGVREHVRDEAIAKAIKHAQIARETRSQEHAREAIWQRDLARSISDDIRRNRAELSALLDGGTQRGC